MGNEDWSVDGGGTSFPFDNFGDWVKLRVEEFEPNLQQTDRDGKPKTWPNGAPVTMDRVGGTVVSSSNPEFPAGTSASLYLRGSGKLEADGSGSTRAAAAAAIKETTGGNRLAPNGELTMQYTGERPPKQRGDNPAKLYKAWYALPALAPIGGQPGVADPTPAAPAAPAAPPGTSVAAPTVPASVPGSSGPSTASTSPASATTAVTPTPGPSQSAGPAVGPDGLTDEQRAAFAALEAEAAPAWDSDPRVAPLRARGVADDKIRAILGI